MKQQTALTRSVALMMPALVLAGCGISRPVDVTGLRRVVGADLAGARGATPADQRRIDRTVVGLCAGAIWTKAECERHGPGDDGSGRR
ncbi:hypothetical protein PZN02_003047 [Sinorhizobium garamanticum]|uniref:Lipoprotein n=1 Tax=Sinorhizobium garamanticum TaxID=680247 RepID=A0ABY8D8T3_9HYPH|nr:hypothetical protein [Sinorhizobium garamanticum]WEX86722.1 hypothetical protein PZN02_003047 [Sinorhizobium garamanticum]